MLLVKYLQLLRLPVSKHRSVGFKGLLTLFQKMINEKQMAIRRMNEYKFQLDAALHDKTQAIHDVISLQKNLAAMRKEDEIYVKDLSEQLQRRQDNINKLIESLKTPTPAADNSSAIK